MRVYLQPVFHTETNQELKTMKSASLYVDKLSTQTTRVNLSALNYNSERISEFSLSLRSAVKFISATFLPKVQADWSVAQSGILSTGSQER